MAQDPRTRQIKIHTGVVKRLRKELSLYKKEAEEQKLKVERLKTEGEDEYVIKKQVEVLAESEAMIPDCNKRLVKGQDHLRELLEEAEGDLADTEEYKEAMSLFDWDASMKHLCSQSSNMNIVGIDRWQPEHNLGIKWQYPNFMLDQGLELILFWN